MIVRLALLLLFPLSVAAGETTPAVRPTPPSGLSWEEADSLKHKIQLIETLRREGAAQRQSVLVTQGELNSFLGLGYAGPLPKGLSAFEVRFDHERIEVIGYVDLDAVGRPKSSSRYSLISLVAGKVPVQVRGRLLNQSGFGTLELEEVWLSSLPLPLSLLEHIVTTMTRSRRHPNGFDIRAPFRLPYAARRVRLQPGRAFLDF